MRRWRPGAIGFGVAVETVLLFGAVLFPAGGAISVAIAGGLTAGALAGGGWRPGLRHGVATAVIGAVLVAVAGLAMVATVGLDAGPFAGSLDSGRLLGVYVLSAALMPVVGGIAGAVGGRIRGTREFPDRLEREPR